MIMTTIRFRHRLSPLILGCAAALLLMGWGSPLHAQTVAVMVNGEPITNYDIEQRGKLNFLTTRKPAVRQEVIDELINEKVKIKEGKKFGVDPSSSDIDASFASMAGRMRTSPEQLAKSLEGQGIRIDTLRHRIKSEIVWGSLVRGRFKESLQVAEKDVAAAVEAKGEDKQEGEAFEYQMRPIVLIVPRGSPQAFVDFQAQGGRGPARPRPDLRRSKRLVQIHAKRGDTRHHHQDVGRHTGGPP